MPRLLLALVLLSAPLAAQDTRTIADTIDLGADGRVVIDTYKGSITVSTWDGATVELEARIEAADDDDAELVHLTDVHVRHSRGTLSLETDYDRAEAARKRGFLGLGSSNMNLPYVHYTLRVPRTTELVIDDYKSEIDVRDLDADVTLESYKGEIYVARVAGTLTIDTYKGEVEIEDLDGALRAETYKGRIDARFADFSAESALETYKGDIALTLPARAGFDLDADLGRRGDLDLDRPAELTRRDNRYRGPVNGGGPALRVETDRGTIRLREG